MFLWSFLAGLYWWRSSLFLVVIVRQWSWISRNVLCTTKKIVFFRYRSERISLLPFSLHFSQHSFLLPLRIPYPNHLLHPHTHIPWIKKMNKNRAIHPRVCMRNSFQACKPRFLVFPSSHNRHFHGPTYASPTNRIKRSGGFFQVHGKGLWVANTNRFEWGFEIGFSVSLLCTTDLEGML